MAINNLGNPPTAKTRRGEQRLFVDDICNMPATISCVLEVSTRTLEEMKAIAPMYTWPESTPDNDA
eukprot:6392376-Alexandrium_andersonii.AAC.1